MKNVYSFTETQGKDLNKDINLLAQGYLEITLIANGVCHNLIRNFLLNINQVFLRFFLLKNDIVVNVHKYLIQIII